MDKIDQLFENEINNAIHAYPSVYSKEDVASLLTKLQMNVIDLERSRLTNVVKVPTITSEAFNEFAGEVESRLAKSLDNSSDLVDYSTAEFSIEYDNKICLDSVEVQTDTIIEFVNDILLDEFEKHFGKVQE